MSVAYPVLRLLVPPDELELAAADLWNLDTVGVEEVPTARAAAEGWLLAGELRLPLQAGFASVALAHRAEALVAKRWSPHAFVVDDDGWLDTWREHFEPFRVGRLVVLPAWKPYTPLPVGPDDLEIHLDPGRSFGTGAHPSTRLVLELLQSRSLQGASVLDVGCGSGILSVAAAHLGARTVTAVDVEEAAIPTTLANAARNSVYVEASATAVSDVPGHFDVVLANILAPVLVELSEFLVARLTPTGIIVLSGLISDQRDRVLAAYPALVVIDERIDPPWLAVALTPRHSAPSI